jgi:ketosteroid isomerase-like protein
MQTTYLRSQRVLDVWTLAFGHLRACPEALSDFIVIAAVKHRPPISSKEKRMWRNSLLAAFLLVAVLPVSLSAQAPARTKKQEDRIVAAVRAVIDAQREAWNRGDVEGYMDGYARSKDTVFVSGDNVTRGWQTVLDRYKKNYDSREKMGTLTFSDLEITPIGTGTAIVLGRWHLQRAKDEPHGRFTLIFRKTKQGWRIVHDHTSSA